MHFFLVHTITAVLIETQSQGISRPRDRLGVGTAFPKQSCHLKTTWSELWYFTERQGLKPGHILSSPFAFQPQRWGWKELNVRQAGWGACNTPSNTDVCMQRCQDHQLNWSSAKSRKSPISLTPTPLCILLLCFAHTAQPRQQRLASKLRDKNVCRVQFHSEP